MDGAAGEGEYNCSSFELNATIRFVLRKDHPDYDEEDDNFVATLHRVVCCEIGGFTLRAADGHHAKIRFALRKKFPDYDDDLDVFVSTMPRDVRFETGDFSLRADDSHDGSGIAMIHYSEKPFDEAGVGLLFHQLFKDKFNFNWDAMLAIGGFWIELDFVQKNTISWSARDLSEEVDIARALNQMLEEAEEWAVKRSMQCRENYFRSGGVIDCQLNDEIYEDVETNTEIACVRGRSKNVVGLGPDPVIVVLHERFGVHDEEFRLEDHRASFRKNTENHDFRHCWLFHDLYDHHRLTWEQVLAVKMLWIRVHFIQQRIVTFPSQ